MAYNHKAIEKKWQEKWEEARPYRADDASDKKKFYCLVEFPYPSGSGLHCGHLRPYASLDAVVRKKRMEGLNVLFPIGWDAFGLPTENYAIKTGRPPQEITKENTDTFRRQMKSLGLSFDWSREVNTTDPGYYKWTQWMFLQFYKAGLAYKAKMAINWCPKDKIGLANEEVIAGKCERCGTEVEKREKEQWMIAITKYADRLLSDLDTVNYLPKIKKQQQDWIGKSEGAEIDFALEVPGQELGKHNVRVFTTRPDTIFGATFVVVSPEVAKKWIDAGWQASKEVETYVEKALNEKEEDRTAENKEKTGVDTGVKAINPANNERIPVFVADYVLGQYGTGAIMAVPAHDERDHNFATKFNLPIHKVVGGQYLSDQAFKEPLFNRAGCFSDKDIGYGREDGVSIIAMSNGFALQGTNIKLLRQAVEKYLPQGIQVTFSEYTGSLPNSEVGIMRDSGFLNGFSSVEAKEMVIEWIKEKKIGKRTVTYKLRDWVFSRQRYWGEPIPLVHCEKDGWVSVPVEQLPVELPSVEHYEPTDTGESPLATITDWVNTTCPSCGGAAKRETDTMPNWAGSSWYFLRYADAHNDQQFAAPDKLKQWMPVDLYNGGMEHTTLHLLYSRFWNKFLFDQGLVPTSEPYARRHSHGLVLADDGTKMSKSKGNVVNPDEMSEQYGADALRMYIMFMGPFEEPVPWSTNGLVGVRRFLDKVMSVSDRISPPPRGGVGGGESLTRTVHKTIKKVGDDMEAMKFNTAISQLMICVNAMQDAGTVAPELFGMFLKTLFPFAPHLANELWEKLGNITLLDTEAWPTYDSALIKDETVPISIQVMGKLRGTAMMSPAATQEEVEAAARSDQNVAKWLDGQVIKKVIYIQGRTINFVV